MWGLNDDWKPWPIQSLCLPLLVFCIRKSVVQNGVLCLYHWHGQLGTDEFKNNWNLLFDTESGLSASTGASHWHLPVAQKAHHKGKCYNLRSSYTVMGKMSTQSLHLCSAAQNTFRNMQGNVCNWTNNYSICIRAKPLCSYTLYYWQYNFLCHTRI